jgi:thioesterase domain-containing protein
VVLAREEGSAGRRLVAYLVGTGEESLEPSDLRSSLRDRLPEYMVPSVFVMLPAMPLTANGKVDRKALPAPEQAGVGERAAYVAPRDETERLLAGIWEELLGREQVGIEDDFFTIGGHSLLAVRVMARVRRELGRDLPLVAFFRDPTVRGLAAAVGDPGRLTPRSALVPIQAGGSQPPFFCVHAVGGHLFPYIELARRLGPDQPVYGFQVPESDEELDTIEALAARYVDELLAAWPEGPYRLGGWSMGGLVAFEMARQLVERGKSIEQLVLFDTGAPSSKDIGEPEDEAVLLADFARDLAGTAGGSGADLSTASFQIPGEGDEQGLRRLFEQARAVEIVPAEMSFEEVFRLYATYRRNRRALRLYRGRALPVRVTLFTAEARGPALAADPTLGWSALVAGVEARKVPGDHYSILRAPQVERLAVPLRERLAGQEGDVVHHSRRSS